VTLFASTFRLSFWEEPILLKSYSQFLKFAFPCFVAATSGSLYAAVNFGSVSSGYGAETAVTVTFPSAMTLTHIEVLTQGAANLDFTERAGGTCAVGMVYAKGASCTVEVGFEPLYAGTRYGALVLTDASKTQSVAVTEYLQGFGRGPQISFSPTSLSIGKNWVDPAFIAVDGKGNVFVNDDQTIYKETPKSDGSYTRTQIGSGFGVAVDGAGNVYIVSPDTLYKETLQPDGSYVQSTIGGSSLSGYGVAVDGSGNLYVCSGGGVVKGTLSNGAYSASLVADGFTAAEGVAVDGNGNVYVADNGQGTQAIFGTGAVYEEVLSNGSYESLQIGNNWGSPASVAVDGVGNVYVADQGYTDDAGAVAFAALDELVQSGGVYTQTTLNIAGPPESVTADEGGNVFYTVASQGFNAVYKLDIKDPPLLAFASTVIDETSSDSPQVVTVSNFGNAGLEFNTLIYPADFPESPSTTSVANCTAKTVLVRDSSCALTIDFKPVTALGGKMSLVLKESVIINTNAFGIVGRPQKIAVTGTETKPTTTVALASSTNPVNAGIPFSFTAHVTGTRNGPTPTGIVTFYSGSKELGEGRLSHGVATYDTHSLAVGNDAITAKYSGDENYLASASQAFIEYVLAAPAASILGDEKLGAVSLGKSSGPITLTVKFDRSDTLGSIEVLTQGAPGRDFTDAGGGTCTPGASYAERATCTVKVAFAPKHPGTRMGAVVLTSKAGSVIATGYLQGTGRGPQTVFTPGTASMVGSGYYEPSGVAVDGAGNVYVADTGSGGGYPSVYKETLSKGRYIQTTIGSRFVDPIAVAVDGAGNVYVADNDEYSGNGVVYKETLSSGKYIQTTIGVGYANPSGVAVDGSGNVYVADSSSGPVNGAVHVEYLSNGKYVHTRIGSRFISPTGVAVDGSGNVYVSDGEDFSGTGAAYKETFSDGKFTQSTIGSGLISPSSVAVDGSGNVYLTDTGYGSYAGAVYKETLSDGKYIQTIVGTGGGATESVAVDGSGNVYAAYGEYPVEVEKLDFADPPPLSFAATAEGATSKDSPRIVTIANQGNSDLKFSSVSFPADFPEQSRAATDCKPGEALAGGASCTLSIDFKPTAALGSAASKKLAESVSVTTNTANAAGTRQKVVVRGTETAP
jgi:sugar lactone lactonase YvrE